MQILEIVLYDITGLKRRILPFKTGSVNIITGKSATGKSALIDIVDYCLAKGSCNIPHNLRKYISWFGLKLLIKDEVIFIARQNPYFLGIKSVNSAYYSPNESPEVAPSEPNTSIDGLKDMLSLKLGITKARFIPDKHHTRSEFDVNIRHSLDYCFQQQEIISNKNALFSAVNDTFKKNDLKNTFPYFLGVIPENKLDLLKEKENLEKKLKAYVRTINENKRIIGEGFSRGVSLITECKGTGLIDSDVVIPNEIDEIKIILKTAQSVVPSFDYDIDLSEQLHPLYIESNTIKDRIKEINQEIESINCRKINFDSYNEEKTYQYLRLKPINLFDEESLVKHCPLCSANIEKSIPKVEEIKNAFTDIATTLENTTVNFPKLDAHINRLNEEKTELQFKLKQVSEKILALKKQEERYEDIKGMESKYLITVGRISLWLESFDLLETKDEILDEITDIESKLAKIAAELNDEKEKEKFRLILDSLNVNMTEVNKNLKTNVEHKNDIISYNPKDVTIMIYDDDSGDFYPLNETGSAENHLYFHLITLSSLHRYFIKHNRPVPNFLIIDQPTQVYFPADDKNFEETGEIANTNDRQLVLNLFEYLFDFAEELKGQFQIIVMDHANLSDKRFQDSITEEWRGDLALIPYEWMGKNIKTNDAEDNFKEIEINDNDLDNL